MPSSTKQEPEELRLLEAGLQRRSGRTCCAVWKREQVARKQISKKKNRCVFILVIWCLYLIVIASKLGGKAERGSSPS